MYKEAGVDIEAGNEAAKRYAKLAASTMKEGVLGALGGFAGGFQLDLTRYPEPVLFTGTDGVGTKLKIAFAMQVHNTIGIDCVAMCVNDVLTSGAEPLLFLDYLSTGSLDVNVAEAVVAGVATGCEQAGCALVGGETAEMPGMYAPGEYDLAGFTVGVANKSRVVDGSSIQAGDAVIGLASNGVHSNGYSLVRKVVEEAGLGFEDPAPFADDVRVKAAAPLQMDEQAESHEGPADTNAGSGNADTGNAVVKLGEVLLRPTRIYVQPVLKLLQDVEVQGMAHITGGGLIENIPRVLPEGLGVDLSRKSWQVPAVFSWLQDKAGMGFTEAARVWNQGIGYIVIVRQEVAAKAAEILAQQGEQAQIIGRVTAGDGVTFSE
ncbi:phosphoribosylformylglycinamidine cyclo-ligase [Alicyclobacillus sp. SO9]|uniref:phosphoribosylformylglycinamidine cyclo-ligase n=1 Tax=Alicyclobacillus sp. SO9 TaxID=2665646 RepID=UPI0018E711BF|nr:phosphoribosylformylglycinamidine cyclo-ligase [Alicyclobacillus sp. SO9]QQE81469.1 phosphoribosylformylglycinamidine cyclo-ligase [Alicyclobacillus sp. SO9]